jgi:hypothetical protein
MDQEPTDYISVNASGSFAAIYGIESPFTNNRSLISIMAANPSDFTSIDQALSDSNRVNNMFGSMVILRNNKVASYNVGSNYYVGELPIWQLVWYHFSNHPILMAFLATIMMLIISIALWRVLRQVAIKRIIKDEETEK